jgi:hypothetical protein
MLGALNRIPESYSPKGAYGPDEIGDKVADTLQYGLLLRGSPK